MIQYEIKRNNKSVRLKIEGRLDVSQKEKLMESLNKVKEQEFIELFFDFEGVTSMDSCAIGTLLGFYKRNRFIDGSDSDQKKFEFSSMNPQLEKLLIATRFVTIIPINTSNKS